MVKKMIFGEFVAQNIKKYIAGIAALVASSIVQLTLPKILGIIIDNLKEQSKQKKEIALITLGFLLASILLFGLKYLWRFFIMGRARHLECFLRAKLFAHLQTLSPKFYNDKKTGDLMAYAINDIGAIRHASAFGLVFLIDGIIINVASLLVMVKTINVMLTFWAMLPLMAAIIIIFKLGDVIKDRFIHVQESYSKLSGEIQENISGIRVIKAFCQEDEEIKNLKKSSLQRMETQMEYIRLSSLLGPLVQICFGLSFAITLVLGSHMVFSGRISLGDFIAFNTYLGLLTGPVSNIGRIVEVWQRALASAKRLDEIFNVKSDFEHDNQLGEDDGCENKHLRLAGEIKINNLSFCYPNTSRRVLKDISLEIPQGKTLGIAGKTGSGKTTLINLLLRLYEVERGKIFIDGVDINDIPLSVLRENIGYVPQDNFLFSAPIKENIKFFSEKYSEDEVEEAARMSCVYENIIDFPEGFETVVGERGITLSGGQKQRVSIARAIIKDPSILILDDSLSAVDASTEEQILKNIKQILRGRTGIIIANRISAIRHSDEIIFLDKGKIVERGTHDDLIKIKGRYYGLYCAQSAEHELESTEEGAV